MSSHDFSEMKGPFAHAHNFALNYPTLIEHNYQIGDNRSIELLAENTIVGAEYDSSERDPPPQCHPGTRLEIFERMQQWIENSQPTQKVLWLHGPAGVGKSAIMQTLAEAEGDSILGATIFFSRPNERDNPQRIFTTIAYQLAVKFPLYRKYVIDLLVTNPKLVGKSMAVQFQAFIVKPFCAKNVLQGHSDTVLIILDGLDECRGEEPQRELILLIGRFAVMHPNSPVVWAIASRPEPHIRAVFANPQIRHSHWEINIPVDSNEGCADVERFLRDKFLEIRERYPESIPSTTDQHWPSELVFVKIAKASSGLFIFAALVIRFIADEGFGNPVSQLLTVLDVIESTPLSDIQSNPLILLDNLYQQIFTAVPVTILPRTKLLLGLSFNDHFALDGADGFGLFGNLLSLSQADVYGTLRKLHSVISVPVPGEMAHTTRLVAYHASFTDYTMSPVRSGHYCSRITKEETLKIFTRVLLESHNVDKSVIDTSRVRVSWVYGNYEESEIQQHIWWRSLSRVVTNFKEVISSGENIERLSGFFADLDYAIRSSSNQAGPQGPVFCGQLENPSSFLLSLESWGLVQAIDLHSINLDCVRSDVAVSSSLVSRSTYSDDPRFLDDSLEVNEEYDEALIRGKFVCDRDGWKTRVREHLADLCRLKHPPRVYIIGKGRNSAVWMMQSDNDRETKWYYCLPYCKD